MSPEREAQNSEMFHMIEIDTTQCWEHLDNGEWMLRGDLRRENKVSLWTFLESCFQAFKTLRTKHEVPAKNISSRWIASLMIRSWSFSLEWEMIESAKILEIRMNYIPLCKRECNFLLMCGGRWDSQIERLWNLSFL